MTTTSTMHADLGRDFGTGLRRNYRFVDGAAQFAQACVRNAARAAQAIARKRRARRDMRQLMSMSEHRSGTSASAAPGSATPCSST